MGCVVSRMGCFSNNVQRHPLEVEVMGIAPQPVTRGMVSE